MVPHCFFLGRGPTGWVRRMAPCTVVLLSILVQPPIRLGVCLLRREHSLRAIKLLYAPTTNWRFFDSLVLPNPGSPLAPCPCCCQKSPPACSACHSPPARRSPPAHASVTSGWVQRMAPCVVVLVSILVQPRPRPGVCLLRREHTLRAIELLY